MIYISLSTVSSLITLKNTQKTATTNHPVYVFMCTDADACLYHSMCVEVRGQPRLSVSPCLLPCFETGLLLVVLLVFWSKLPEILPSYHRMLELQTCPSTSGFVWMLRLQIQAFLCAQQVFHPLSHLFSAHPKRLRNSFQKRNPCW